MARARAAQSMVMKKGRNIVRVRLGEHVERIEGHIAVEPPHKRHFANSTVVMLIRKEPVERLVAADRHRHRDLSAAGLPRVVALGGNEVRRY